VATRSQAFGLDPEKLDHRINQNNENNFVFINIPTPTQNNSRSTRQITYLESRTKLPIQTVTSAYGSFFVEMSGETVGLYDYNEEEHLLVKCLNQGPAACFKLYLICSVLFVFGGMLSNLEGVLLEKYSAEEEQQIANAMAESALEAQNQVNQVGVQNCQTPSLNGQISSFQNPNLQNTNFQNPNFQNPNVQNPNFQNPNFQNTNVQNPNFQNPNFQHPNFQNTNSQAANQQNPRKLPCCAKLANKIGLYGLFYHVGSVLLSLLVFFITITLVLTLQAWAKHNSVNTIRPASSANNMTLTDPVYIFYLLVTALPMLAYVVTSCSVPCGSIAGRLQKGNLDCQQQRQLAF